jgi:Response regulator containing CheY-like receiver, AAA-type ATPase, and DNA-binding domains
VSGAAGLPFAVRPPQVALEDLEREEEQAATIDPVVDRRPAVPNQVTSEAPRSGIDGRMASLGHPPREPDRIVQVHLRAARDEPGPRPCDAGHDPFAKFSEHGTSASSRINDRLVTEGRGVHHPNRSGHLHSPCSGVHSEPSLVRSTLLSCTRETSVPEQETHRTILLVEDDPDIRDGIADILRGAGKTVVEAEDGQDALDKLEQVDRPCLILLDLRMPRMDGFEFLRRLNEHPDAPDFPVLVLSAHASVDAAQHYPGVLGTLRKPFPISSLLSWVDGHC